MTIAFDFIGQLSDQDLLAHVERAASRERDATAETDRFVDGAGRAAPVPGPGCSSLVKYCTEVLHLSGHAAYRRIEAARAARRFPIILNRLIDGCLNLTAVVLVAPHLTAANHIEVLDSARRKSKREVEQMVANLNPKAAVLPRQGNFPISLSHNVRCCGSSAKPIRPHSLRSESRLHEHSVKRKGRLGSRLAS